MTVNPLVAQSDGLFHRNKSTQLICQPRIGEVVIVRDGHTPHRAWRLTKIRQWYAVFALMRVGLLFDEDTC